MSNEDQPIDNQNVKPEDGFDYFASVNANIVAGDESQEADEAVTAAKAALAHRRAGADAQLRECYKIADIVQRAKAIARLQAFNFPETKVVKVNGDFATKAESCDRNRIHVLDVLFDNGSGEVPYPHFDTFSSRTVDHHGEGFNVKSLKAREILDAMSEAGLEKQGLKSVSEVYEAWAQQHQSNDLQDFFNGKVPEWDGTPRLESLVDIFKCKDTPLSRQFSKYFWISLYNRIVNPGCSAPIIMSLIGGQDAGKSFFSLQLCWILMGSTEYKPIKLSFHGKSRMDFLRAITGHSIIANMAEMGGFNKADLEEVKDFVTQTSDDLNFKFEQSTITKRQWITIMDGNSYVGLQRDKTGNRRFYPIFVGQTEDDNGQPCWLGKEGTEYESQRFKVDYKALDFENMVWQIMAECREWLQSEGWDGYHAMVNETTAGVAKFSIEEMKDLRGLVKNEAVEDYLRIALILVMHRHNNKSNSSIHGVVVKKADIRMAIKALSGEKVWSDAVVSYMKKVGFVKLGSKDDLWVMPYKVRGAITDDENQADIDYEAMVYAGWDAFVSGNCDIEAVKSEIRVDKLQYGGLIDKAFGTKRFADHWGDGSGF